MRYELTQVDLKAITNALNKGKRVELIPLKYGVRILSVERKELKNK